VDADPHQSLTQLLAAQYHFKIPASLADLRRAHADTLRSGKGLEQASRGELAELIVQQALVPLPGGSLLVMGASRERGCQCVVNSLLGQALDAIRERFDLALVDNEAGIEPIGRHAWEADVLLLVTTPRPPDLDVAGRILIQAQTAQRQIGHSMLIVNRFQVLFENWWGQALLPQTDFVATLPYSKSLEETETPDVDWLASLQVLWHFLRLKIEKETADVPAMVSCHPADHSQ
jgi:CO dehydrogenase nickel-insertion accessory protein CooC1